MSETTKRVEKKLSLQERIKLMSEGNKLGRSWIEGIKFIRRPTTADKGVRDE